MHVNSCPHVHVWMACKAKHNPFDAFLTVLVKEECSPVYGIESRGQKPFCSAVSVPSVSLPGGIRMSGGMYLALWISKSKRKRVISAEEKNRQLSLCDCLGKLTKDCWEFWCMLWGITKDKRSVKQGRERREREREEEEREKKQDPQISTCPIS